VLAVVVPEVVEEHWWDYVLLNNFRTRRLCAALMRHGGPNLAVVLIPWAYEPPRPKKSSKMRSPDRPNRQLPRRSLFDAARRG
jgi:hypothetical protein